MGCGCVSQHKGVSGPRLFLGNSDAEFLRTLDADELKDKKRLLAYFHMLNEGQFEVTTAFVEQVRRKGVPDRYRWQAWRALSGWTSLYKPGMYEKLSQAQPDHKVVDAVQKDLDRTFPKLEEFDEEKKKQLAVMVHAYACLVPQIGYCQGMNFIAGFLLLAAGSSHEDAFFMFVQIMAKYRASLLFCDGLLLLKLLTFQFGGLLESLFPEVHRHFLTHCITPELYVTKWMLTVFTQPLDFDSAARVWDIILCDGIEALVLICLASVQLLKARLLKQDTEGILELLSLKRATTPPTGGEIVQAALNLKMQHPTLQELLSKLRDDWVREHAVAAADLGRAELAFCTPIVSTIGLELPREDEHQGEVSPSSAVALRPQTVATPDSSVSGFAGPAAAAVGSPTMPTASACDAITASERQCSPVAAPAGSPLGALVGSSFPQGHGPPTDFVAALQNTSFSGQQSSSSNPAEEENAPCSDIATETTVGEVNVSALGVSGTASLSPPRGTAHASSKLLLPSVSAASPSSASDVDEKVSGLLSRSRSGPCCEPLNLTSEYSASMTNGSPGSARSAPSSRPLPLLSAMHQSPSSQPGSPSGRMEAATSASGAAAPKPALTEPGQHQSPLPPLVLQRPSLHAGEDGEAVLVSPTNCRQSLAAATEAWGSPKAPLDGDFSTHVEEGQDAPLAKSEAEKVSPRLVL